MAGGVAAPTGARWGSTEIKTDKGQKSLGKFPILLWDSGSAALAFYGEDAIAASINGTSLNSMFRNIARRGAEGGKSVEDIARQQLNYRPGQRANGSKPSTRVNRAAKEVSEKIGADKLQAILEGILNGSIAAPTVG